jgi:hypothetical protein
MFHYGLLPLSNFQLWGLALDPRTEHADGLLQSPKRVNKNERQTETFVTQIIFIL